LDSQEKKYLSDIRMAKAKEFFQDAEANYREGRYKTSVNRSYYAALNASRSILILEGANPETPESTVTMLGLRFIKPSLLPMEIIKKFKTLFSRKADVDYGDFETTGAADAEDSLTIAREMVEAIDAARIGMTESL
jgi:uncharacterized protein (UPF0332 family)